MSDTHIKLLIVVRINSMRYNWLIGAVINSFYWLLVVATYQANRCNRVIGLLIQLSQETTFPKKKKKIKKKKYFVLQMHLNLSFGT